MAKAIKTIVKTVLLAPLWIVGPGFPEADWHVNDSKEVR